MSWWLLRTAKAPLKRWITRNDKAATAIDPGTVEMSLVQPQVSDGTEGKADEVEVHTGFVKSIPPTTENWLRKPSIEDKHETNHINNKGGRGGEREGGEGKGREGKGRGGEEGRGKREEERGGKGKGERRKGRGREWVSAPLFPPPLSKNKPPPIPHGDSPSFAWRWVWQTCLTASHRSQLEKFTWCVWTWVAGHLGRTTWFVHVHLRFRWVSVRVCILCQCAGEALFKRATRLERCPLVTDRDQAPVFHESSGCEGFDKFGHVYVDNIGVLATSPAKSSDVIGKVATTFDNAGLLTHEVSVSDSQSLLGRCWIANIDAPPWRHVDFGGCDAELMPCECKNRNWFHTRSCHRSCHVLLSSCTSLDDMISLSVQVHPTVRAVSRDSLGHSA